MAAYAVERSVGHCKGRIAIRCYGFNLGVVREVAPQRGACCEVACNTTAAHTYGALAVAYCCDGRDVASE